jgi:hypothetical protein
MEVGEELTRHKRRHPELAIERRLLLYYPLGEYFYVTRSAGGAALARRISVGLERMLGNGSFDRMFQDFKRPFDEEIGFRSRLLMSVPNPLQTLETPLTRRELWYDPTRDQ